MHPSSMTNSPAPSDSSHDSGNEDNDANTTSKSHTAKDRECQYCHQKFTSSSLGRHLDQFLSKKKPDGIHNVDEIRRLRGGITRRTARNNHKKEQDESQHGQHSPSPQYTLPSYSELLSKTTTTREEVRLNRPHWQATGVITDPTSLNPPTVTIASPSVPSPSVSALAGQKRSFSTYAADTTSSTSSETIRALELSLREILDAVRAATKQAAPPPTPFEFEFGSQTFPYLCLALLQVPPTLFQTAPFATPTTISIAPPGLDQYESLRQTIMNHIDMWKWNHLTHIQRSNPAGTPMSENIDNLSDAAQNFVESSLSHLDAAYQNFMSYSVESRHNLWTIELLRALNMEQEKVKKAKNRIERMTQEANQLQQQLDHLSRCQWPREMALWPPDHATFDPATLEQLRKYNVIRNHVSTPNPSASNGNSAQSETSSDENQRSTDRWDYDRLISKWRKHVREDRARRTGVQPSVNILQPTPPLSSGPGVSSGGDINSPGSTANSTPRYSSMLTKGATMPDLSSIGGPNNTATSRPGSALAMSSNSNANGIRSASVDTISNVNSSSGATGGGPGGTGSSNVASNGLDVDSNNVGASAGPGPRRRIGIISDVDEHYGPRLAGFRRDR